jgi:hypothetical protein
VHHEHEKGGFLDMIREAGTHHNDGVTGGGVAVVKAGGATESLNSCGTPAVARGPGKALQHHVREATKCGSLIGRRSHAQRLSPEEG